MQAHFAYRRVCVPADCSNLLLPEDTDINALGEHLAVHGAEEVRARCRSWKTELRAQGVNLESIVMIAVSGGRAWAQIAVPPRNIIDLFRAVGLVPVLHSLRQSLGGAGNVEDRPVQYVVDGTADHRIGIVENDDEALSRGRSARPGNRRRGTGGARGAGELARNAGPVGEI